MIRSLKDLAVISLGANLDAPDARIREAFHALEALSPVPIRRSSLWQSQPVDCPPGSPLFINAIVCLTPFEGVDALCFLRKLQAIETQAGRQRPGVKNAPRVLDLDLIAFKETELNTPELCLPHPRALTRRFVLTPLAELAPEALFPGIQKTVRVCLESLTDTSSSVTPFNSP